MFSSATLAVLVAVTTAADDARTTTFDGVTFTRQFVNTSPSSSVAEYVPPGETVDNWTKLVGVYSFPDLDDPGRAAAGLAQQVTKTNPLARSKVLVKDDQSEAMVDFITWPEDAAYAEFNVFRYLRVPGQPGLIAFQFAYRFTDTSPEASEQMRENRQRWVEAMSQADFPVDFSE